MSDFFEYVREATRAAGYNIDSPRGGGRKALAEATGMSQASVSRMLAGSTVPDARFLEPIAAVLNVPVTDLLHRAGIVSNERASAERKLDVSSTVSANVRSLRRARGWTQVEAAQRFAKVHGEHWSNAVWSQAEQSDGSRQRAWSVDELVSVAQLFGASPADLLSGPQPICPACQGKPPAGFTCNTCSADGGVR